MTRTTTLVVVAATGLLAFNGYVLLGERGKEAAPEPASSVRAAPAVAAGPGLIEPVSEEVRVATEVGGRLDAVLVDEGDQVHAGQVVATIANQEQRAQVAAAEAEVGLREAEARRVRNGARDEERRQAEADVREADAVLEHARAELARYRDLFHERVIARHDLDRVEQQEKVAGARAESVRQRLSLVDSAAREEDRARAASAVALARARLAEARARLTKTSIVAPIAGIVVRRHRKPGELVSTEYDSPIVTLADRSRLRVRVDVDEADVAGLRAGQPAYVTADAFGTQRFPGRVVRVGQRLGRKNLRTDEPTERVDLKVLETLVELDDGHELPLGLRVQAFILSAPGDR